MISKHCLIFAAEKKMAAMDDRNVTMNDDQDGKA